MTSFSEELERGKREVLAFNDIIAKAVDLLKQIENQRDGVLRDTRAKIFAQAKKELIGKTIIISDPWQGFDHEKIKIIDITESVAGSCFFCIIFKDLSFPNCPTNTTGGFTYQTSYQEVVETDKEESRGTVHDPWHDAQAEGY